MRSSKGRYDLLERPEVKVNETADRVMMKEDVVLSSERPEAVRAFERIRPRH